MSGSNAPHPHPLQGASVLVAGASGGIGSALAAELHRRGATLTLVARNAECLDRLEVPGARCPLDLRLPGGCAEAVGAAVAHAGRLDIVVNAAGVVAFGPVSDISDEALEDLFRTNAIVPVLLARAALRHLSPGGAIVNISGVIAEQNLAGMAAYGSSKAAVRAFDQALAREARRIKVRVLDARPPHTETGLADRAIEGRAPALAAGLSPASVAATICEALEQGAQDLPSTAF